ncbi:MAG TPA: Na+/H+ antiporter NhaA [Solirubrobacteraceae bacterium]|jgi:Na+/H+ antiporter NhaA|nr:Na+/H+ antiporter NhaA [Solirubrobacteraceae bacterium]
MADAHATPLIGRTAWARNLATPVRDFLSTETGSAIVLLGATIVALLWSNSPWSDTYESVWTTKLSISLGGGGIATDLRHWVNEGLMTFFFLVVGLEAKREFDMGELRERRRLAVPVLAALGGMAVPVGIFLLFNAGGAGAHGWGAAMSTDTAFALGALALLTPRVATRLRVFLLTLAVVDDLGALVVIATAYTKHLSLTALAVAAGLLLVLLALRFAPPWRRQASVIAGVALWIAMFKSGIDPVIAGLIAGLATSASPPAREDLERATELTRSFREQPTPELARTAQRSVLSAVSLNERLQYALHPWTSYVVVPLFALANAGIHVTGSLLGDAVSSPITLGIFLGYVVGKPVGILGASWLASRPALHGPRPPISWPLLVGGGAVAGIGFTVSLLISGLAFSGERLAEAKLGVLTSAIVAPLIAWVIFRVVRGLPSNVRARQISGTAEDLVDLSEDVDPERDHIRGPADASVTLVEYGDFECPYCGQAEPVVRELLASSDDDVRYVWRHLPLNDVHGSAQLAAEAIEAANAQGAFWDVYDAFLAHQDALAPADITKIAQGLGLDLERFWSDVRHHEYAARVAEDVASADASGVSGTPTFFINGRRHQGAYDIDTLSAAVRAARGRARLTAAASS